MYETIDKCKGKHIEVTRLDENLQTYMVCLVCGQKLSKVADF